jgi:gliding motility-associated-like protein
MNSKFLLIVYFFLFIPLLFAQNTNLLLNPSFEGSACSISTTPDSWMSCVSYSSPDIFPGCWNIHVPSAHGSSYINLVKRRPNLGGNSERITTYLTKNLDTTKCYFFSVDIAVSSHFDAGFGEDFSNPADVMIGVGISPCQTTQDTILYIKDINQERDRWITYSTFFRPNNEVSGFQIKALHGNQIVNGHVFLDNIIFVEYDSLTLISSESIVAEQGEIIHIGLETDSLHTYQWISNNTDCILCSENTVHVTNSDVYILEQTMPFGCVKQYVFKISIIPEIPNVFTPNRDGVNDLFDIDVESLSFEIVVLNRWGQGVFISNDNNTAWDGSFHGNECPEGVYFYKLKFTDITGIDHDRNGFLHLIRE